MARRDGEDGRDPRTHHIDVALGARLKRLRAERSLTQGVVAQALGLSDGQWSKYETGESRLPAARLWQFCARFGVSVEQAFADLPHHVGPDAPGVREGAAAFDWAGLESDTQAIVAVFQRLTPEAREWAEAAVRGVAEKDRRNTRGNRELP